MNTEQILKLLARRKNHLQFIQNNMATKEDWQGIKDKLQLILKMLEDSEKERKELMK